MAKNTGYLRHLSKCFADKEKTHAVDIGANLGLITNKLFDLGWEKVTAFEPTPVIYKELVTNTKDKNVVLHNVGVSNRPGKMFFAMRGKLDQQTNQIVSPNFRNKKKWDIIKIKTVSLDSLELEPIDLLKIDVEGHEKQVVEGAELTIKKHKPVIVLEVSYEGKVYDKEISRGHEKSLDLLLSWGYTVYTKVSYDYVLLPEGYNG